ncbi:hypothetical protein [Desulfohalovibrio reitneri]|uniref:hypothetical protein n=1 Tax=Desulfohalovibrio reitneri TaxID=1307759 RepID=UPI0004A6BDAC|nr:hypothetical protein [Desulfohalovibrio reitneri]
MPFAFVTEGSSGIVTWRDVLGRRHTYHPRNDTEAALDLLFAIHELRDARGNRLRNNYLLDGFNWYASQVNTIYWRMCFRLAQYGGLIREFEKRGLRPVFKDKRNFARIWELLHPTPSRRRERKHLARHREIVAHNRAIAPRLLDRLLFFRYGPSDFRSKQMLDVFEDKGVDPVFCYSPSRKLLREKDAQPHPVYFLYRQCPGPRLFSSEYNLSGFDGLTRRFLAGMVERTEWSMSQNVHEYRLHVETMRNDPPGCFFGIDDAGMVYGALAACKELGVPSVGYQLGMYGRRQAGYVMEGFSREEHLWFDNVVVWGPYWERVMRRHGDFPEGYFLQGANKHGYAYRRERTGRFHRKNVLVPYEFWGDTAYIGRCMMRMMDLGYTVYFKFKPDERPELQLASYELPPEYERRLVHVHDITDDLMGEINIVAGAMTTLLFDLLPYGKHTWVLDTEFRLLDDMVEDGFAELVSLEDIENMDPQPADLPVRAADLFNPDPLDEVLSRHVISRLPGREGA